MFRRYAYLIYSNLDISTLRVVDIVVHSEYYSVEAEQDNVLHVTCLCYCVNKL